MRNLLLVLVYMGSMGGYLPAEEPPPRPGEIPSSNVAGKKLIRIAQESIFHGDIEALPSAIDIWQQSGLDGICFSLHYHDTEKGEAQNMAFKWWDVDPRSYEDFGKEIAILKGIKNWGRLTDNFLWTSSHVVGKRPPDWFSDEDWETVLKNTRLAARLAREAGFKGLVLDGEAYGGASYGVFRAPWSYRQYAAGDYSISGEAEPRSFDAVRKQVKARGKQWAEVLTQEYPEIVLFILPGLYEVSWQELHRTKKRLEEIDTGLWPSFLDGVIAGLGERVKLVDGNEATYLDSLYHDMLVQRDYALNQALTLSDDPKKARARIEFAVGLWTDAGYGATQRFSTVDSNLNQRTPDRHRHAVHNALAASDRYAWLWGEWNGDGASNWLPQKPTPVLKDYWKANELGHLPIDLQWEIEPVFDLRDYTRGDELAKKGHEQFWKTSQQKGYRVMLESLGDWKFRFDPEMKVRYRPWNAIDYNDVSWFPIDVGRSWQSQGTKANGIGVYRVSFEVSEEWAGKMKSVYLAFSDLGGGENHVYMNDAWIETAASYLDITKAIVYGKTNQVTIVCINRSGPGGLTGEVKLVGRPD